MQTKTLNVGQKVVYYNCWWRVTSVTASSKDRFRCTLEGLSEPVLNVTVKNLNGRELLRHNPNGGKRKN